MKPGRALQHIFFTLAIVHLLGSAADDTQDDRCYLSNGGSSETFTVREDLATGSIIGTLPILGDPSEDGDIELTLQTTNSPVVIQNASKNFILNEPLDKEGITGLSSVLLEVACRRRETDDPSITIPVRIFVTDANDNAPVFVGAPYSVNISEVTVVGSTVIQGIKAIDKDQTGPFSTVAYEVDPGPYSHLVAFENTLEGHVILTAALDYETLPNFTVFLKAQDQGIPPQQSRTTLTVNVLDADDQNPRFLYESYKAVLPDVVKPGMVLRASPASIKAEDPDAGIRAKIHYSFNSDCAECSLFEVNGKSGQVMVRKPLPDDLRLPLTLVIKAVQEDNPDRYSLTTLTLERNQELITDLQFRQREYVMTVLESAPVGQVVLTVHTNKPNDKLVRLMLLENSSNDFAIQNTGEIIVAKPLDYEKQTFYSLRVIASDGKSSDVARINITIMNVNDNNPTFAQTEYNFLVKPEDGRVGRLIGLIEVKDNDVNDTVELHLEGPYARVFSISPLGELRIRSLEFLNSTVCTVTVVASDSGVPLRKSSVTVTVRFPVDFALSVVSSAKKNNTSLLLMIIFGALLGLLIIVIITLTIYILKTKHYRNRLPNVVSAVSHPVVSKMAPYISSSLNGSNKHQKGPGSNIIERPMGVENPVFNMKENSYQKTLIRGQLPPAPSEVSSWQSSEALIGQQIEKLQNIYWPNGSIPRRVKKLSWEDEQPISKTELDPDVSVIPLGKTCNDIKHPGLTVYF